MHTGQEMTKQASNRKRQSDIDHYAIYCVAAEAMETHKIV